MKILLFGGDGQLGYEVRERAEPLNFELVSPVLSEVDITEREQVHFLAGQISPDIIFNCAAYTAVDKAEEEQEQAFQVNRDGARNVAEAARELNIPLIHISTDYVFDGTATEPIPESAKVDPINVYGASKLAGDEAVKEVLGKHGYIVRTSSLHGQKGENFVHTMLRLFAEREVLTVVDDQIMSPTWAGWLAEVMLDLSRIIVGGGECPNLLHASSVGGISWFEFASEILELARAKVSGAENTRIEPVSSAEFVRPAKRPRYSVFDTDLLSEVLQREIIDWKSGLKAHLTDIDMIATA